MQAPRGVQLTGTNWSCGLIAFSIQWKAISTRELWKRSAILPVCGFQRNTGSISGMFFSRARLFCRGKNRGRRCSQFGGHKAVVRPDPIPNSAVKHGLADGSGCIASARVGRRHSLKLNPENILRVFSLPRIGPFRVYQRDSGEFLDRVVTEVVWPSGGTVAVSVRVNPEDAQRRQWRLFAGCKGVRVGGSRSANWSRCR
jgi:hypothetical protein